MCIITVGIMLGLITPDVVSVPPSSYTQYPLQGIHKTPDSCRIIEFGQFLKYRCKFPFIEGRTYNRFKCHNTDEFYSYIYGGVVKWSHYDIRLIGPLCSDDPTFYQVYNISRWHFRLDGYPLHFLNLPSYHSIFCDSVDQFTF